MKKVPIYYRSCSTCRFAWNGQENMWIEPCLTCMPTRNKRKQPTFPSYEYSHSVSMWKLMLGGEKPKELPKSGT